MPGGRAVKTPVTPSYPPKPFLNVATPSPHPEEEEEK